jgi:hypothetical protein
MTEQHFTAAADLAQTWRDAYQAVFEGSVTAQERRLKLVRTVVEHGIEELRAQSEAARELMGALSGQPGEPAALRDTWQMAASSATAAQERGIKLAQTVVESGIDELKLHGETAQHVAMTLARQAEQQVSAFQFLAREGVETCANAAFAPFALLFRGFAGDK